MINALINYSTHMTHACNIQFILCNVFINYTFVWLNIYIYFLKTHFILFFCHTMWDVES